MSGSLKPEHNPTGPQLLRAETVVLAMTRDTNRGFWIMAIAMTVVGLAGLHQRGAAMPPALLIALGTVLLFALWLINAFINRMISSSERPVLLTNHRVIAPDGRAVELDEITKVNKRSGAVLIETAGERHTLVLRHLKDPRAFAATLMDLRS